MPRKGKRIQGQIEGCIRVGRHKRMVTVQRVAIRRSVHESIVSCTVPCIRKNVISISQLSREAGCTPEHTGALGAVAIFPDVTASGGTK